MRHQSRPCIEHLLGHRGRNRYHRKSAIRRLRQTNKLETTRNLEDICRKYGTALVEAHRVAWGVTDRLCSKRLKPFLPESIKILRRPGEITISVEVEAQLCQRSPATIDRLRRHINFFQPVMKLVAKTRHGAKVHKVYDTARTPYQRLLRSPGCSQRAKQHQLAATYHSLNPRSPAKSKSMRT